ncbi:hypothetical protein [Dactylosporangium sp. NPDC051541]|uniref:hypothetical protein n=1 Tax=Dactylosporangium sp. NPDC051541 TaxID=3363977 RepID=UPI00378D7E46
MRLLTVAAGVAVGYVLGARAGREKYDQIVASTGRLRANPTPGQAVQTVQELFASPSPTPAVTTTPSPTPAVATTTGPGLGSAGFDTSSDAAVTGADSPLGTASESSLGTASESSLDGAVAPKPRKRTTAKATTKPITPETATDLETPV